MCLTCLKGLSCTVQILVVHAVVGGLIKVKLSLVLKVQCV